MLPGSMAAVTEDDAKRLGAAVRDARERRRLTQTELAEAVGVSLRTIGNVERGETAPQLRHRAALEAALHWTAGSVRRVLEGGRPAVTEENSGREVQVNGGSVGGHEKGREPYLSRREGPNLSDVSTDALLEEIAKRARSNNPDATR